VHGTKTGAVIVDMSTINPGSARRIGVALRGRGVAFLDAPVTGMEVRAREGTLSILVGGEKKDLDKVRDVLSVLGNNITHFGKQGAGQLAKACNQILCAVNMMGIVEALHLARLGGLDPAQLVEAWSRRGRILGAGALRAADREGRLRARRRIALMLKDLGIIEDTARELGLPLRR
jgi:3-hydroxyisobutyrate dehydrogenase-like beta-hydroxyacid dehydrogenase